MDEVRLYLEQASRWTLAGQDQRIERTFWFANFRRSLDFARETGELAESEQHHPDIAFGWGYVTVSLRTKKIKGLHQNDFIMAAKIDRLAREHGALEQRPQPRRSAETTVTSET
jgi:4a-hydroxytetrahydrobiopterin dehydratase